MGEGKFGEPWEIDHGNAHTGGIATLHGRDESWAEVWTPRWGHHTDSQNANADRIVACVNTFAGIDDPAAHLKALEARVEAFENQIETVMAILDAAMKSDETGGE